MTEEGLEARTDSLDLGADELRELGHAAVDLMVEALEAERTDPVLPDCDGPTLRARFDSPLPREGESADALLAEIRDALLPAHRKNGHPRFFGYVCGSADPLGAVVDGLASFFNQNVTAWRSAPGATVMERLVVRWLDELVGFSGGGHGLLVSGGSAANATGISCAVRSASDRSGESLTDVLPRLVVYRSAEGHLSFAKAFRLLGIDGGNVRDIAADAERRMDPVGLDRAIARDIDRGLIPACVSATAGTVNTGAVDPLNEIADVCERRGVWLHVDGAYGAPVAATSEYSWLRDGLARADSLSIDPHKWLFAPIDVGCVLLRDESASRAVFREDSAYTEISQVDPLERFAFFDHGLEMTRRARALKVWAILKGRGADRLARIIEGNVAIRRHLDERVAGDDRLELLGSGLSISCFRWRPHEGATEDELNAVNRTILDALVAGGRFFLSPTTLEGRFALRICIVNFRTRVEDVDLLADEVLRIGGELWAAR